MSAVARGWGWSWAETSIQVSHMGDRNNYLSHYLWLPGSESAGSWNQEPQRHQAFWYRMQASQPLDQTAITGLLVQWQTCSFMECLLCTRYLMALHNVFYLRRRRKCIHMICNVWRTFSAGWTPNAYPSKSSHPVVLPDGSECSIAKKFSAKWYYLCHNCLCLTLDISLAFFRPYLALLMKGVTCIVFQIFLNSRILNVIARDLQAREDKELLFIGSNVI